VVLLFRRDGGRGWSRGGSCVAEGGGGEEEVAGVDEVVGVEGVLAAHVEVVG